MDERDNSVYEQLGITPRETPIQWGGVRAEKRVVEEDTGMGAAPNVDEPSDTGGTPGEGEIPLDGDAAPVEEPAGEGSGDTAPPLTAEERARNAARRRKTQEKAAVEAALKAEREAVAARTERILARAGFKRGDKLVVTLDDLEACMDEADQARLQKDLKAGNLTPELLESIVDRSVSKATAGASPVTEKPPATDAAAQEAFQAQVETELAAIRQFDPGINSVADLMKLERAGDIYREVTEHGHNFEDAYRFVYADKIASAKAATAAAAQAQRVRNGERGKEHLKPFGSRGAGSPPVTAEEAAAYRAVMPGMTDEQIQRAKERARMRWGGKPSQ